MAVQILKKEMEEALKRKTANRISLKKTQLFSSSFKKLNLNKQSFSESQILYLSQNKEKTEKLWQKADTGSQKSQRTLVLEN